MDLENTGKDWMEEAPLLAAMDKKNPFSVPANYFGGLEEHIKLRCAIEGARFSNEDEFTVPAGYFESLPLQIESRIAEQNIRNLASGDGFKVPEGYFNNLQKSILTKTLSDQKVHKGLIKPIRSNWIRYAAAACITLAVSSVFILNNQKNNIESRLGKIPEQEIVDYLQIYSDMGDTPLIMESISQNVNLGSIGSDISEAELEEYINTTL